MSHPSPSHDTHPCYSEQASHRHARLHLPVAPACNIQCHYCNRKFDCANESRPGVTTRLHTPEQAAAKAVATAQRLPGLSVVGVAGPGDPLANPTATFRTFRLVRKALPGVQLCLSTNGLALPDHLETIQALGIHHVTLTLNALDPEVAARIYPWVYFRHQRHRGEKAANLLLARQKEGLEGLVAQGVLVKVNTVLIPGVNDGEVPRINRFLQENGVSLHNVVPLISQPAFGSYYGVTGQRGPTEEEMSAVRESCTGGTRMMRHCRQCRADAEGLLGEERPTPAPLPVRQGLPAGRVLSLLPLAS